MVAGAPDDSGPVRLTAYVDGRVQGVGFRYWVRTKAIALGLTGSAANLDDGQVEVIAEGPAGAVRALLAELTGGQTPGPGDPGHPTLGPPARPVARFHRALILVPMVPPGIRHHPRDPTAACGPPRWSRSAGAEGVLIRHVR